MMPPSGSPANVPMTASAPSLLIVVKSAPLGGVNPSARLRVAPPRLTLPVTLT